MGTLHYEYGDETGNTLYLDGENVFLTDASEVEAIYNDIKNFVFYSYETSNCPISDGVMAGDIITFSDGTNTYPTIAQYDLEYFGGWIGGYSLSVNTERQEETQIVGNKENIKNIRILVDRQNNVIQQTVEDINEQNNKISQVTQTVDELDSKIQDIADITVYGESTYANVSLDDINQSEPIMLKVYPTTENISYLYPRSNLYPASNLYMKDRTVRFTRSWEEYDEDLEETVTRTENIDYELPDDLLRYSNDVYDEFYLNYDSQTCQVTKRCEYNADGTVSALAQEIVNTYDYPQILLEDGDYTITLPGYNNGYIFVRLMAKNIYTSQFATKTEVSSEINQTAESITSTVSETYETKQNAQTNYSQLQQTSDNISSVVSTKVGNNEVISKINQSSEAVTINANKIGLSANDVLNIISGNTINLTSKNIAISSNNFNVTKNGNLTCTNANITGKITTSDATITGGNITMLGGSGTPTIEIHDSRGNYIEMYPENFIMYYDYGGEMVGQYLQKGGYFVDNETTGESTKVWTDGIVTPRVTQTSLESQKKNFEKLENALGIIKATDIYKYNLKSQKDGEKKHIGFVIGKNYKYSENVTSEKNDGVDIYSFVSVCCKAIQEQQEQIEQLKEEIKKLKEEK